VLEAVGERSGDETVVCDVGAKKITVAGSSAGGGRGASSPSRRGSRAERSERRAVECAYDAVFDPGATQLDVYRSVAGAVSAVLRGINCTVFAYGQTGTGKTHTMLGRGIEELCESDDLDVAGRAGRMARGAGHDPASAAAAGGRRADGFIEPDDRSAGVAGHLCPHRVDAGQHRGAGVLRVHADLQRPHL
jgi:hypothetical protein